MYRPGLCGKAKMGGGERVTKTAYTSTERVVLYVGGNNEATDDTETRGHHMKPAASQIVFDRGEKRAGKGGGGLRTNVAALSIWCVTI